MNYKIIDNVLPQEEFEIIKNNLMENSFPWNKTIDVTHSIEVLPTYASYYFTHMFWEDFNVEPAARMFAPLLRIMNCRAVRRIKGNCYPSTPEIISHDNHYDYPDPHKGAIFYVNNNNGLTVLEDKVEVESIENRLLLFDPTKLHRSTTCTDTQCRINVNFNYF